MKKWLYLISVGSLTAIFLVFYLSDRSEAAKRQTAMDATTAQQKAQAEAKKKEDEARAKADAEGREKVRRDEELAKEAERRRRWDETSKRIQDETNGYLARADKAAKESARLELELDSLHKAGEKANREMFEAAKRVERAESERQAAELEIQRTTEFIARRAAESSLTRVPAPPLLAAPAR